MFICIGGMRQIIMRQVITFHAKKLILSQQTESKADIRTRKRIPGQVSKYSGDLAQQSTQD